jgi:two-component sensor histidine kinase
MRWLIKVMVRQPKQSAIIRWVEAILLFVLALIARLALGTLHGANPAATFYPIILLSAAFLGWEQATFILLLSVAAGIRLFLPVREYLLPVTWLAVGGMTIAIIAGLRSLADELSAANERQRLLFRELQHRVANTLQTAVGTLELSRKRIGSDPAQADQMLATAATRLSASADVHRRLHDPALFQRGLETILQDAIASVVDRQTISLNLDIELLDLSFDQMSVITMLTIEAANNAQKHVFQHGHGSALAVTLKLSQLGRVRLVVKDDGPGTDHAADTYQADGGLGLKIVDGLVKQVGGILSIDRAAGTVIAVEFPLKRQ